MKRVLMLCGVIAFTMGVGALAHGAAAAKFHYWNPAELKFTETAKGIERTTVWGDLDKGDWGALVRFQAGTERGWHTHSHPVNLTMISGTLVFDGEGSAPMELGPGSGVSEPANAKHNTRCKEGESCLFLITGAKKYDFKPSKAPVAAK